MGGHEPVAVVGAGSCHPFAMERMNSLTHSATLDVSVCIVNWNCRELLRGCLASLHEEQGVALETIVVDNGSADGAAEMVARCFPAVRLVRNRRNEGFARANNQAASLARGRFLFFLNNDTVVPPLTLRKLLDYARSHPDVGMIGPRLRGGDGEVQASYRPRPTLAGLLHRTWVGRCTGVFRNAYRQHRRDEFDPDRERRVQTLMGAALFLRREVFERCGPWDEDFAFGGEDLHFSERIGRHHPLVFLPDVEVIHYGGVSTRQHIGYVSAARAAGLAQYLRKAGYSTPKLMAYKVVVTLDLPLQLAVRGLQYLGRRLRGDARAEKSRLAWRGAYHFLTHGLGRFWRA
jgi:GT2 family glycosyltransferase